MDEIEKAFAGTGTDSSGTKTEMTGTWLTWMEDKGASGSIFIGPPGAAKTMLAKAVGNEGAIPTVYLDFSAMQNSLVGRSGENLRAALKVIEAISGKQILVLATCNKITSLPPEVRRRFTMGTFFFDLPTEKERQVIWKIYLKKYDLKDSNVPRVEVGLESDWPNPLAGAVMFCMRPNGRVVTPRCCALLRNVRSDSVFFLPGEPWFSM